MILQAWKSLLFLTLLSIGGTWVAAAYYYENLYTGAIRNLETAQAAAEKQKDLAEDELRKERENKKANVQAPPTPTNFKLSLLGGNIFVAGSNKNLTGIDLEVQIRNSGQPSRAADWKLNVIKDGQSYPAQFTKPPPKLALDGEKSGRSLLQRSDFDLDELSSAKPLHAEDKPVRGHILFYIAMQQSEVLADETVLELSVEDDNRKRFSSRQKMGEWMRR